MGKGSADKDLLAPMEGRVGLAIASYNKELMDVLENGFEQEAGKLLGEGGEIVKARVPGSLELGHALSLLADIRPRPVVLVALGCVIRGETYHFEIVSQVSASSVAQVGRDKGLPVINGILTCETQEQAMERCQGKGAEFARAACQMANLQSQLP